jgi:uncharacterized membrane protein YdjX (TVP38/TMEM64 family)
LSVPSSSATKSRPTWRRYLPLVRWGSLAILAVSVLLTLRRLPVEPVVQSLAGWLAGLGVWAPVIFGLLYVAAVVLLVPGSALTLAAGALFGLLGGVLVASAAATTGSALAFLIARYLARDRIAHLLERYPKFRAIDRAISAGGWKIVVLLRLSPAVPFNLQNYLYGLTGIRFWPCVLASAAAMLPGTFLYVYLGYLGRAGLEAAAGGSHADSLAGWGMAVVGLAATVVVTVYVTRLARRALRQQPEIAEPTAVSTPEQSDPRGWPWGTALLALVALAALAVAVYVQIDPALFQHLFAR